MYLAKNEVFMKVFFLFNFLLLMLFLKCTKIGHDEFYHKKVLGILQTTGARSKVKNWI